MAVLEMYAVYDKAVGAFARPFYVRTKGEALRSFIDECSNPQSELCKHSRDYSLALLGTFDESSGSLTAIKPVEFVLDAIQVASKGIEALSEGRKIEWPDFER